jgi:hypothetical protein
MTDNIWNVILSDGLTGKLWQCQFGMKEDDRGCIPMTLDDKRIGFVPDADQADQPAQPQQ